MPNSLVKSFAKKTGKSVDEVEKLWDKASDLASKKGLQKGTDSYYAYTAGILKKMLKVEKLLTQDSETLTEIFFVNLPGFGFQGDNPLDDLVKGDDRPKRKSVPMKYRDWYEVIYSKLGKGKLSKFWQNLNQAKSFMSNMKKEKYKVKLLKNGKPVKESTSLLTQDPDIIAENYLDGTPHRMRAEPIGSASTIFKRDKFLRRRDDKDSKKQKKKTDVKKSEPKKPSLHGLK